MTLRHLLVFALVAMAGLFGPIAATPGHAASAKPLVLEDWFRGPTTARGFFVNTLTGERRDLVVDLRGTWSRKTQTLTLDEKFFYADGERDRKIWTFTRTGPGTYIGRRDDVVGTAKVFTDPAGRIRLQYTATLGGRNLAFDDTLELRPDGTVINTATVSYFFLTVGKVELVFNRGRRASHK